MYLCAVSSSLSPLVHVHDLALLSPALLSPLLVSLPRRLPHTGGVTSTDYIGTIVLYLCMDWGGGVIDRLPGTRDGRGLGWGHLLQSMEWWRQAGRVVCWLSPAASAGVPSLAAQPPLWTLEKHTRLSQLPGRGWTLIGCGWWRRWEGSQVRRGKYMSPSLSLTRPIERPRRSGFLIPPVSYSKEKYFCYFIILNGSLILITNYIGALSWLH